MKAEELRLNNLIDIGGNTMDTYQTYKPTKVTVSIIKGIHEENDERPDAILSVYKPITLTENWYNSFEQPKENEFIWIYSGNSLKVFHKGVVIKIIRYVHEYQNFYHALTGHELLNK